MKRIFGLLIVLVLAIALVGCNPGSVSEATQSTADASAAQVKAIDNNPHMPPEMKEQLKARLNQQKQAGEALSNTSKGK